MAEFVGTIHPYCSAIKESKTSLRGEGDLNLRGSFITNQGDMCPRFLGELSHFLRVHLAALIKKTQKRVLKMSAGSELRLLSYF